MNQITRFKLALAKYLLTSLPEQKAAKNPAIPSSMTLGNEITMNILGGVVTWSGQNAQQFVNQGYAGNDIVYSVIKLISDKAKVAPWGVYKLKPTAQAKKDYLRYKGLIENPSQIKDWSEIEHLKNNSLVPYESDDRLNELIRYPNQEDTWADLVEAMVGFYEITGNAYMYGELIPAGNNAGKPLSLLSLPAQWMSIIADVNAVYARATGYRIYMGAGLGHPFSKNEILHNKMFNPQWNASGQQLYGFSPLFAAQKTLTRINESLTAAVANLQNGGPAGVLYADTPEFNPADAVGQAEALKRKLVEYSGSGNKNKIAVSGYKVGWQEIGLSNVDLAIIEGEKHDLRSICNVYGVPSQLLNDPENKIQANALSAEKALTVRAAIPALVSLRDNLNRKFNTDWGYKGQNIIFDFDLSVYPELQEDKLTQAQFLDIAMVTLRQRYQMMGMEADQSLSEDMLNTLFYKGQPVSEPGMNEPIIDPYKQGNE